MGNDHRLNLISSILLTILGAAILVGSINIGTESRLPLHSSPGLMSGMLGVALLLSSLALFRQAIAGDGLRTRAREAGDWIIGVARHPATRSTLVGVGLMVLYTFVLVPLLQFWLATLIFMIALLGYLRATTWYWILAIAGGTVGAIYLLFTTAFNVPLP